MDVKETLELLDSMAKDIDNRLAKGLKKRRQMSEAIECGEEPEGYRAEWIKETSQAILDVLIVQAEIFNEIHTDDRISVADMGDALMTTINRLKAIG